MWMMMRAVVVVVVVTGSHLLSSQSGHSCRHVRIVEQVAEIG